jgi:hypothetical protein
MSLLVIYKLKVIISFKQDRYIHDVNFSFHVKLYLLVQYTTLLHDFVCVLLSPIHTT